jgi:hypothetical protein
LLLILVAVAAGVRLVTLDAVRPDVMRGHRVFVLAAGAEPAAFGQVIDVEKDGLAGLHFEGDRCADAYRAMEVRLVELLPSAEERQVRVAALAQDGKCCTARFAALPDSSGRRYRVELRTTAASEGAARRTCGLLAQPANGEGGLVINGNPQASNLIVRGIGAPLGTLKGERRLSLPLLLMLYAAVDALVVTAVCVLASASSPRPA